MAWHKKCSLLLWNHHKRSFTYCPLIQPAIWELSNTILFVVFGNFRNEVKYVGMSFQREGDIFSSLSFDSKFLWCLSECHLTLICQKISFQNPEDAVVSNFVISHCAWLFLCASKSQSTALLWISVFYPRTNDFVGTENGLGVFMQYAISRNKYCNHFCIHY